MTVSFGMATSFTVGAGIRSLAIADLNGDGRPDLVAADANGVSVLLDTGSGYGAPTTYAVSAFELAVADLNGDGAPDVAFIGTGPSANASVGILFNQGAQGLAAPVYYYYATFSQAEAIAAADVTGDGRPDVVISESGFSMTGLAVFANTGGGTFGAVQFTEHGIFPYYLPDSLAVGDFNGDGIADVVIGAVGRDNPANVEVLLGNGSGGFTFGSYQPSAIPEPGGPAGYEIVTNPASVAVGDANGDGHADLLLIDSTGTVYPPSGTGVPGTSGVVVLYGDGTGGFPTDGFYATDAGPVAATVADVTGDGHPDLIVAVAGGVDVLQGDGAGGFGAPAFLPTGETALSVQVADVNGDGAPDIVLANPDGTVSVLLDTTAPCYVRGTRILTTAGEVAVEALRPGDLVVTTLAGQAVPRPVRWLGHRRLGLVDHPRPDDALPIRIRAGALGDGRPHRDLLVSPGHRLRLEHTLIRALDLVNGATIVQERPPAVEYWHVELDRHDIVLAEGVEAETYQDTGNRAGFENAGAVTVLHPVLDGVAPDPCLPYGMPSVALRKHLTGVAEALGWERSRDPQPWLQVGARRIEARRRGNRHRFTIPAGCTAVRLCSRAARPCDADPHAADWRRLGLALVQLRVTEGERTRLVPLDDAALGEGLSHVERDEHGWAWRWTDGDAALPLAAWSGCRSEITLEVTLDEQALLFWVAPRVRDAAAA